MGHMYPTHNHAHEGAETGAGEGVGCVHMLRQCEAQVLEYWHTNHRLFTAQEWGRMALGEGQICLLGMGVAPRALRKGRCTPGQPP